jgi:hypothetical protein
MPLNETLMAALEKRYGRKKAEEVYWGMAGEGKGPFGPRGKYRAEHEAIAAKAGGAPTAGKKKPRPSRKAGAKVRYRR